VTAAIHILSCEDAVAFVCDSTTPFAEVDASGRFVWLNSAYCEILNAPAELIVGTHFKAWTHEDDIEIDSALANKVRDGVIPGYTLSKKYIQRGSTPQNRRIVWGMLTVSGKWLETREFSGYRVQFQSYTQSVEPQKPAIRVQEVANWILLNWKTLVTIVAVSVSLIAGSSATLLEALQKAKSTVISAEQVLQSSPSGASVPPPSP